MNIRPLLLAAVFILSMCQVAHAQTLNGFITDQSSGQALEGATVALYHLSALDGAPVYGTATNSEGFYIIGKIRAGTYQLRISFVGYEQLVEEVPLTAGVVKSFSTALAPDLEIIDEVVIESERTSGAARITAGHQHIRPEEIELIPAPDISADLANYLTTLPGIVTSGDRGGQLFVRGGEPSQNLTMFDGMIVYQPIHVLGLYSVFPADIIDRADFYAGGFGAKYAGRTSSTLNVSARPGNNRRFAGMASVSPFTGTARLEGPIVPGKASFIISGRESYIDQTSERLYGDALPFYFSDVFGKIQFTPGQRQRFSATAFSTFDRGRLVPEIIDDEARNISWSNEGFSFSWLALSKSLPIATKLTFSRSHHEMTQAVPASENPVDPNTDGRQTTTIQDTRIAIDATFSEGSFLGGRSTTIAGWEVVFGRTRANLNGLFQNLEDSSTPVPSFGFYVEPEITYANGLTISSGVRLQSYNTRIVPFPEPRLRIEYEQGIHNFSGAIGVHNQQLIGLNDRRDPAGVFTAWTGIPRKGAIGRGINLEVLRNRIGKAIHMIAGYRAEPLTGIELGVEGFYKRYTNLFVAEWTAFPRLTTRLQPAKGRSFGFELRIEVRRAPFYGYITYGLTNTEYAADGNAIAILFGDDALHYRPPHDRRHNLNALVSTTLAGIALSMRWQFGSGLPYTRPLAFDGFALVDDIKTAFEMESSRRIIYDRPYGDVLPIYHRLDASIEKTWHIGRTIVTLQGSALNLYDRRNLFYVDIFTLERADQLPFIPSAGLKVAFE